MASLRTPTGKEIGSGVIKVLHVTAAVTGDTISYKDPVGSWLAVNLTTTDALSISYSSTTQLFTVVVANTPDIDIWILP